jgi:hypothetical protein
MKGGKAGEGTVTIIEVSLEGGYLEIVYSMYGGGRV